MSEKKTRVFIIGASGYIGNALTQKCVNFDLQLTSSRSLAGHHLLDLKKAENFNYKQVKSGDFIIFASAISSPEVCNNEYSYARQINVSGTTEFIRRVIDIGARVIFLSSDTVYGECSAPVYESSSCNPLGHYAEMKHEVEKEFQDEYLFKTTRLSYVFSKNDKFTKFIASSVYCPQPVEIYKHFHRSIVYLGDVLDGIFELIINWEIHHRSTFNFAGPATISREDFVRLLKSKYFYDLKYTIGESDDEFWQNRPRRIEMASNSFETLLGRKAKTLQEAIEIEFGGK